MSENATDLAAVQQLPTVPQPDGQTCGHPARNLVDRRELTEDGQDFVDRRQSALERALERRESEQDRRDKSDNRRTTYRFPLECDGDATIVVREERKSLDEDGEVQHSEIVDSSYDVTMLDQSSGGFGFLVDGDVPLEVGHVIRLATAGGMALVRVCRILKCDDDGDDAVQHVGGQFIDDLVGDTTNVSVLELFVDRRLNTTSSRTTVLIIGTVCVTWSAVIAYTILSQF